ncbi:hypothetical protein A3Q33_05560 [Colwellia sp. PAMC 21821]|nr:hypothetical protein A3Q33_05560 [Colwellia sp. PAMC 21821]
MYQELPPPVLVETWLDIINNKDMPIYIINKRTKLINYFFGSVEFACRYIKQSQFNHQKAS